MVEKVSYINISNIVQAEEVAWSGSKSANELIISKYFEI